MVVCIDESRHNNHAGCVHDDGRFRGVHVPLYGYDLFPLDEDVALLEISDLGIHTEHDSVLEQDGAPVRVHQPLQSSSGTLWLLSRYRTGPELGGHRTRN